MNLFYHSAANRFLSGNESWGWLRGDELGSVRSLKELEDIRKRGEEAMFLASALNGEGVVETLHGLLSLAHVRPQIQYL